MRTYPFPHPCFLTHERSFFSLAVLLHSRDGKPIDLKERSILLDSRKPSLPPTSPFLLRLAMFISDSSTPTPTVALTKPIRIIDGAYVHVDYAFPNLLLDRPSNPGQMPSPMGSLPSIWFAWEMSIGHLCWSVSFAFFSWQSFLTTK